MEGFWYYAVEDKPVGPLTFAQLTLSLSGMPDPRRALLWHASFDGWREAPNVPEILAIMPDLAYQPPIQVESLIKTERRQNPKNNAAQKTSWRKTAGTALSVVIFAICFGVVREV